MFLAFRTFSSFRTRTGDAAEVSVLPHAIDDSVAISGLLPAILSRFSELFFNKAEIAPIKHVNLIIVIGFCGARGNRTNLHVLTLVQAVRIAQL